MCGSRNELGLRVHLLAVCPWPRCITLMSLRVLIYRTVLADSVYFTRLLNLSKRPCTDSRGMSCMSQEVLK